MKTVKSFLLTAIIFGGMSVMLSSGAPESQSKVTLCHKGANGNVTLRVDRFAVSAHLGHGDTLGPCGD